MAISPSSFDLWSRCRRAWYYRYVVKATVQEKEHLARGTAIHTAVEGYLLTGEFPWNTAPDILQRARKGEAYLCGLRLPGWGQVEIESWAEVDLSRYGGVDKLRGRLDWKGRNIVGMGYILDHKSTAKPSNFLTPEAIVSSAQLHAYAAAKFPGETVTVGHIYYPEDPHSSDMVTGPVEWGSIENTLERYAKATVEIGEVRKGPIEGFEPDTSHCWDYGGCDYAGVCPLAPASLRERNNPATATPSGEFTAMADLTPAQKRARALLGLDAEPPTPAAPAPAAPEPTIDEIIAQQTAHYAGEASSYAAREIGKLEAAGIAVPPSLREIAAGTRGVTDTAPSAEGIDTPAEEPGDAEPNPPEPAGPAPAPEAPKKRGPGRPRKNPAPADTTHPGPALAAPTVPTPAPTPDPTGITPIRGRPPLVGYLPYAPVDWDVLTLYVDNGDTIQRNAAMAFGCWENGRVSVMSLSKEPIPGVSYTAIEDPRGTVTDNETGESFESADEWARSVIARTL